METDDLHFARSQKHIQAESSRTSSIYQEYEGTRNPWEHARRFNPCEDTSNDETSPKCQHTELEENFCNAPGSGLYPLQSPGHRRTTVTRDSIGPLYPTFDSDAFRLGTTSSCSPLSELQSKSIADDSNAISGVTKYLQASYCAFDAAVPTYHPPSTLPTIGPSTQVLRDQTSSLGSITGTGCIDRLEELAPKSNEEDPTILTPLLFNLRSLYTKFLDFGCQWQTSWTSTRSEFSYIEACAALISPLVSTALGSILSHYLRSSDDWIAPKQDPRSTPIVAGSYLAEGQNALSLVKSSHAGRSTHHSEKTLASTDGQMSLMSIAAREHDGADMIQFRVQRCFAEACRCQSSLCMTMAYLPRACERKVGISVALHGINSMHAQAQLYPSLKTFGVVPQDSAVIRCISEDDVGRLRKLFALGQAAPSDVDSEGCSLLSVSKASHSWKRACD